MQGNTYDYLVVGAGPGGLQLGYFLERAGRDYAILEAGQGPGSFFRRFPRHRTLISINKVYTGIEDPEINFRWDWNSLLCQDSKNLFKNLSQQYFPDADHMVRYLGDFAANHHLKVHSGVDIHKISKSAEGFLLQTLQGVAFGCRRLIMATGNAKPFIPSIPGIEHAENYTDVSIDPKDFINQRVLIIGKGNSAFETAECLLETTAAVHLISPNPVKFAWKTHHIGHLRSVNNTLLDSYLLKSQNSLIEGEITGIKKTENHTLKVDFNFTRANGARGSQIYHRIIVCTGFRFDVEPFAADCRPEMIINDRFPAQTTEWESTNVKHLYFAGSLMQARDYKKTQSSFIHGFRYNVRALYRLLEMKYHGQPWPSRALPLRAKPAATAVLDRLNRGAALIHQPGFLCDVLVAEAEPSEGKYYCEIPADHVPHLFGDTPDYYVVSLEYGPDYPDFPFEFNRFITPQQAHLNPQIHPVIRRYRFRKVVAEHHILEEMDNQWIDPIYTEPFLAFVNDQIKKPVREVKGPTRKARGASHAGNANKATA